MLQIEAHEQMQVARWLEQNGIFYTASAGGVRTSMKQARKLKAMGALAGTPDLMIFEPTEKYHGLFVEMKRPAVKALGCAAGTMSDSQKKFKSRAEAKGYAFVVGYGFEDAVVKINAYFRGEHRA